MITSTIELLREVASEKGQSDPDNEDDSSRNNNDDNKRELARKLLAEVDNSLGPGETNPEETEGEHDTPPVRRKSVSHMNDELVCR